MTDEGWHSYRVHILESLDRIEERQTVIFDKVGKLELVAAKHGAFWGFLVGVVSLVINKLT